MMIWVIILSNQKIIAQDKTKDDIKISFNVYLDNKKVETDSIQVGFVSTHNKTLYTHHAYISNSFVTFFKPNRVYNMFISHPNYKKQIIKINTFKIKSDSINVYLNKT